MKKISLKIFSMLFIAVFILSIAGCGDSGSTPEDNTSTAAGSKPKVIEAALESGNPPFEYVDTDGTAKGYNYELLQKLDEIIPEFKFNVNWVDYNAETVGVQSGKYQLGVSNHFYTEERAKNYLLTNVAGYNIITIVVSNDSPYSTIEDLKGHKVSLVPFPSSLGLYNVYQNLQKKYPSIKFEYTNSDWVSYGDNIKAVASGKYDADLDVKVGVDQAQEELKLPVKQLGTVDLVGNYYLINKNNADLKTAIDTGLKTLQDNGWLGELSKQYFGVDVFTEYSNLQAQDSSTTTKP